MSPDLLLSVDVGTGSVRAALLTLTGRTVAFAAREHEQLVPRFGWSEQRPLDWWEGVVATVREVFDREPDAARRVAAVAVCGQMHGTVLVDGDGRVVLDRVPLWNDKRARSVVEEFERTHDCLALLPRTANPPTVAWPGFKLAWLREHEPAAYAAARTWFMPKDYVNFRLTGERAIDFPEASCTYLLDVERQVWSPELTALLGLDPAKFPPLRAPTDVLGAVTAEAARVTGLRAGTPVAVGVGDYPATLLGSGVIEPGVGSDVTGTSTLITLITERPVLDPTVTNVQGVHRGWGAFAILDAGGDAMRWARRTFHEKGFGYDRVVELAATAPAGAGGLLFLPYLNGERLARQPNSRAQFFGLTSAHGVGHLHRAVMEGVAFASRRNLRIMEARGGRLERLVAAGGGAKTRLWLEIKASTYGCPIQTPADPECGLLGGAMLAAVACGALPDLAAAAGAFVRFDQEILPNPAWRERYERLGNLFDRLYENSEQYWEELGAFDQSPER